VNQEVEGRLPLHYASDYGQLEVLKYLCSKVNILKHFPVEKLERTVVIFTKL
jgi:ankyrin repeat protein